MFGSFAMEYILNSTKAVSLETHEFPCNRRVKLWLTQVISVQNSKRQTLYKDLCEAFPWKCYKVFLVAHPYEKVEL